MSERVKPDGWGTHPDRYQGTRPWFYSTTIRMAVDEEIDKWDDAKNAAVIRGQEHTAREAAVIWRAFVRFRRRFEEADDE